MKAKRWLSYIYFFLAVCFTVGLMACGGGGGGSTPSPDTSAAAGFWYGTSTDANNNVFSFGGLISTDGQLRFLVDEGECFGIQFKGTFTMAGNTGSGTITGYAVEGCAFSNGENLVNGTINFTITGDNMTGTYEYQGDSGSFSLMYDAQAENSITLADLEGDWFGEEGDFSDITVSADGSFTGTSVSGCNLSGQIAIIDPDWSITNVTVTMSGCDDSGTYSGLGLWQFDTRAIFAVLVSSSRSSAFGFFAQTLGEMSLSHPYIFSENASFSGLLSSIMPYYVMKAQITSDSSTRSIYIQNNTINELIPYSPILDLLSAPYFTYVKRFSPIPLYDPPGAAWGGMDYFFLDDTNGNSMMDPDEAFMACSSVPAGAFTRLNIPLVSITGTNFPTISWQSVAGADSYVINFFKLTAENTLGDLVFTVKIEENGAPSYNYTYNGNLFDFYPTLAVMIVTKDNDTSCYYNRSVYATTHNSGN